MNTEGAIAYIRNWREQQNLDALPPQEEREAASRLLVEKGFKLPEVIPDTTGSLKLFEGKYVKLEETAKVVVSTLNNEAEESPISPENKEEAITLEPDNPLFPWEPGDRREFWCEKLQSFVRFTGDLEANGNYWVIKTGEGNFRRWPVKGNELVLKENAPQDAPKSELLLINSAKWSDIKDCLINKFIPSYPWSKKDIKVGDKVETKTPSDVREDMLTLAKSRKKGLANYIEEERDRGRFEDATNFTLRMNAVYESFPWADFTQMLDFN